MPIGVEATVEPHPQDWEDSVKVTYRGTTPDGLPASGTMDLDTGGGLRDFEHVRQLAAVVAEQTNITDVTLMHFESNDERA
jgi:hypothetical protein